MNKDFVFMWWRDGFNKGSHNMYFRASRYGMAYDNLSGSLKKFGNLPPSTEETASESDNAEIDALPDISSAVGALVNGKEHKCTALEQIDMWGAHSRILEMGSCRCSMDVMYYTFEGLSIKGRMEIAAMPRFCTVSLSAHSLRDIEGFAMSLSLKLPFKLERITRDKVYFDQMTVAFDGCTPQWQDGVLTLVGEPQLLKRDAFNGGFSIDLLPASKAEEYDAIKRIRLTAREMNSGALLNSSAQGRCVRIVTDGIAPCSSRGGGYDESFNGYLDFNLPEHRRHFERVLVTLENPTDTDVLLPVCFYKDKGFSTSGVCPILRRVGGEPCGIRVQLSKNWHRMHSDASRSDDVFYAAPNDPRRHLEGPWLHGWCNIPVRAHERVELEYNCLFATWGTLWSASHSQLCLAGWGGAYQLWESSAIGSFGEAFCYDAETSHGRAFIDDIRPLTVYTKNDVSSKKYQWTGCNGGGNFILCQKEGRSIPLKNVRSYFRNQGPNLCQVIHTATTGDDAVDCRFTAFLPRTDDCSRAIHSFEYTFKRDVDYSRFVLYQLGADHYNDNDYPRICIGNNDGPISFELEGKTYSGEFDAPLGEAGYVGGRQIPITVPGEGLFLACLGARMTNTNNCKFGPVANRALLLRSFEGVVNGKRVEKPMVSLYRTMDFNVPCIAMELCLESGKIAAGSRISGCVEYINLPIKKHYYYGTSRILRSFPEDEFDTWRLAHRYATVGKITPEAVEGEVVRDYPVKVKCARDRAVLRLFGGLSYAAVTFSGLSSPYGYKLLVKQGDKQFCLDQSQNGSDFKQAFLADDGWELTFNVELCGDECTLTLEKA